ncbi:MAG: DUF885 domain-containing protein, partial [Acidobacteria bacterium]
MNSKLEQIYNDEWEWLLKEDPIFATQVGDSRYNDQLPDYSVDRAFRQQEHEKSLLHQLTALGSNLVEEDRLSYDLLMYRTKMAVEGHRFVGFNPAITQLGGLHHDLPQLPSKTPIRTIEECRSYLNRLSGCGRAVNQTIEFLDYGLQKELVPPRIAVRDVGTQMESLVSYSSEASPFYEGVKDFPSLQKEAVALIQEKVLPAYSRLHRFWTQKYFPQTRDTVSASDLKNGREWYDHAVRYHTTSDLTAEEIHEIGKEEVQRIHSQIKEVMKAANFSGTYPQFAEFLRTDPQFVYDKAEDLVTGYRDICKRIDPELPKLFGKLPRLPYGVCEIPSFIAP